MRGGGKGISALPKHGIEKNAIHRNTKFKQSQLKATQIGGGAVRLEPISTALQLAAQEWEEGLGEEGLLCYR